MKEHPILFNSEMVRSILANRKTQTRRIIKTNKRFHVRSFYPGDRGHFAKHPEGGWWGHNSDPTTATPILGKGGGFLCPYGVPGDRLWVRETHFQTIQNAGHDRPYICYAEEESILKKGDWKRVPSIHMPRWASRITLEVTGVRVERVQEITTEGIIAEGLSTRFREHDAVVELLRQFTHLWDSINAKRGYGWQVNPWIWIVEFKTNGENR